MKAASTGDLTDWLRLAPQRSLVAGVRVYRLLLSPWLGNACRFAPTCSHYAIEALERHGAVRGTALAIGRIGRCHPWCAGGHDPVPLDPRWGFRRLAARPASPCSDDASSDALP